MPVVAVVGAGLIGRSWAVVFARSGFTVRLTDIHAPTLEAAPGHIAAALDQLAGHGLVTDVPAILARISVAPGLAEALEGVDLVQENGPEQVEAKRACSPNSTGWRPPARSSPPRPRPSSRRGSPRTCRAGPAASSAIRSIRPTSFRWSNSAARPGPIRRRSPAPATSTSPPGRPRCWSTARLRASSSTGSRARCCRRRCASSAKAWSARRPRHHDRAGARPALVVPRPLRDDRPQRPRRHRRLLRPLRRLLPQPRRRPGPAEVWDADNTGRLVAAGAPAPTRRPPPSAAAGATPDSPP